MRSWQWLIALAVGTWLIGLYPAWLTGGQLGILQSSTAIVVCLVPALFTLGWVLRSGNAPEKQLAATLGGSGVRVLTALASGLVLHWCWPEEFNESFWIWILIFYLVLLALETTLVVKAKGRGSVP